MPHKKGHQPKKKPTNQGNFRVNEGDSGAAAARRFFQRRSSQNRQQQPQLNRTPAGNQTPANANISLVGGGVGVAPPPQLPQQLPDPFNPNRPFGTQLPPNVQRAPSGNINIPQGFDPSATPFGIQASGSEGGFEILQGPRGGVTTTSEGSLGGGGVSSLDAGGVSFGGGADQQTGVGQLLDALDANFPPNSTSNQAIRDFIRETIDPSDPLDRVLIGGGIRNIAGKGARDLTKPLITRLVTDLPPTTQVGKLMNGAATGKVPKKFTGFGSDSFQRRIKVNEKTIQQTDSWLKKFYKNPAVRKRFIQAVGTYPLSWFIREEAFQTNDFAVKTAKESGDSELEDQVLAEQAEMLNPNTIRSIADALPATNVASAFLTYAKQALLKHNVNVADRERRRRGEPDAFQKVLDARRADKLKQDEADATAERESQLARDAEFAASREQAREDEVQARDEDREIFLRDEQERRERQRKADKDRADEIRDSQLEQRRLELQYREEDRLFFEQLRVEQAKREETRKEKEKADEDRFGRSRLGFGLFK
jgi:hypothetical protein